MTFDNQSHTVLQIILTLMEEVLDLILVVYIILSSRICWKPLGPALGDTSGNGFMYWVAVAITFFPSITASRRLHDVNKSVGGN